MSDEKELEKIYCVKDGFICHPRLDGDYCLDCRKIKSEAPRPQDSSGSAEFTGSVTVESEAHIIMTEDEYSVLKIIGWHKVCKNIDSAGNIGVQYLGETK